LLPKCIHHNVNTDTMATATTSQLEAQMLELKRRIQQLEDANVSKPLGQGRLASSSSGTTERERANVAPKALSVKALSSILTGSAGASGDPTGEAAGQQPQRRKLVIIKRSDKNLQAGAAAGAAAASEVATAGASALEKTAEVAAPSKPDEEAELRQLLLKHREERLKSREEELNKLKADLVSLEKQYLALQQECAQSSLSQGQYLWTQTEPQLAWRPAIQPVSKPDSSASGADSAAQDNILWIGYDAWIKSDASEAARRQSRPPEFATLSNPSKLQRIPSQAQQHQQELATGDEMSTTESRDL